jgi:uncharacterized protein YyaL (SSP411 family)
VDDYAGLTSALLRLYAADWDLRWLRVAERLATTMRAQFADPERGGFYYSGPRHDALIARPKEFQDNSVPSGNSAAATALTQLGYLLQSSEWLATAEATVHSALPLIARAPSVTSQMLIAADLLTREQNVVVIARAASEAEAIRRRVRALQRGWHPHWHFVLITADPTFSGELPNALAEKTVRDHQSALYHCRGFTCAAPIVGRGAIESFLEAVD